MPCFFIAGFASADTEGQSQTFNTNETFDKLTRKSVAATLRHISENAYFYVEDSYWNTLNFTDQNILLSGIKTLANDFDVNIYAKETSFWGQEPKPGVDNDNHIVILLEQLKQNHGGYFSTSNGFPKSTAPESNEREMIVVDADSTAGPYAKVFLAHEFQHLISFNQKELLNKLNEDVWLNELRSEYAITVAGYNEQFADSNLERRVQTFSNNPSDSLTEWPNVNLDYALVALFSEYIADKYGESLLQETLRSDLAGIASINSVLAGRGSGERFVDIFGNWLAANYINDSSIGPKFGYSRSALKNFRISPQRLTILNGLGLSTFDYSLKPWQVYGHKVYISGVLSDTKTAKLSPTPGYKFAYADSLGRFSIIDMDFYVNNPGGLDYFFVFPINDSKISDFTSKEGELSMSLTITFEEKTLGTEFGSTLKDGALIKRPREGEIYVIEGKYKRYLRPEVIALYGHLDASKAIEVNDIIFNSYTTSNYTRYVNDKKVYAVWPDGTKHWLNITPQQWESSGRDWGAIFIINDLELNNYKTGSDITR